MPFQYSAVIFFSTSWMIWALDLIPCLLKSIGAFLLTSIEQKQACGRQSGLSS